MAADVNDRRWVDRRRIIQLRSSAAIAFYHSKAVRQLPTQFQPFPVMVCVPDTGPAAKARFLPKAEIQQVTPLRTLLAQGWLQVVPEQIRAQKLRGEQTIHIRNRIYRRIDHRTFGEICCIQ